MKKALNLLFLCLIIAAKHVSAQTIISTIAGNGSAGSSGDGGPATAAKISNPWGVATDTSGNIYIADQANNKVRKIDASGVISTFAGTGTAGFSGDGGPAAAAKLNRPYSVIVDINGTVYIGDYSNNRVRAVDPSGIIKTIAGTGSIIYSGDGGPATAAGIWGPSGLAVDPAGNLYISVDGTRVRWINTSGIIHTLCGNGTTGFGGDGGPSTGATMHNPVCVAVDGIGNIYIADQLNHRVRKVNSSGIITTIAGTGTAGYNGNGGPATAAKLNNPVGIAADNNGNVYIGDYSNNCIRKINSAGIISLFAGNTIAGFSGDGGPAASAQVRPMWGLGTDPIGNVYLTDAGNQRIRKVNVHNRPPIFLGGTSQNLTICQDTPADSINTLLAITDSDQYEFETWSAVIAPSHGTVTLIGGQPSTGDTVIPKGFTYTPFPGYSGTDVFTARVTDGYEADTITINVTIIPGPTSITGVRSMCMGSTTTLSSTTTGGTWSSSNTTVAIVGSTGIVMSVVAGTATISYAVPGFTCVATATVTVNPLPLPIVGWLSICTGTITPYIGSGGGIWSSSATTVATAGISSGIITGVSTGTSTITYTLSTGCNTTAVVTVNPLPPPITGSNNVCPGAIITLSNSAAGGIWSSSNTTIAVAGSLTGQVTGVLPGTATISYSMSITGCTTTFPVTVNPLPGTITGAMALCPGSTSLLSNTLAGGIWSTSASTVATVGSGSGIVTGIAAGTTTITYTSPSGCMVSASMTIVALPSGITGNTSICTGAATTLSSTTIGGTWTSGALPVATAGLTTGIIIGLTAGTAAITYSIGPGCDATTTVTVHLLPSAISGTPYMCIGTTTTLTSSTSGGSWTSSNTSISVIDPATGIATGISAGTATITYSLLTGCAATITVTVNALPAGITGTNSLCVLQTATLSTTTAGGTWMSTALSIARIGASTGIIMGLSAGTAVISYTLNTGCAATFIVTINPLPVAISGIAHACAGAATTLSNSMTGGVWTSSNTSVALIDPATGAVSGSTSGSSTITYTLSSGCSTTTPVTINSLPANITGSSTICNGTKSALSTTTGGGIWTSGNTTIATISSSGLVTSLALGFSTITYKVLSTGCVTTATVNVIPVPGTITGPTSVCTGTTVTLSDPGTGGTWTCSNTLIASADPSTGVVTGAAKGTATITYSLGTGCIATIIVTVNPLASVTGATNICMGQTASLTDAIAGGTWSSSNTTIAGTGKTTGVVSGVAAGVAVITYLLPTGCYATSAVTVNTLPPAITGVTGVCLGQSVTAGNTVTGGTWTSSNTIIAAIGSTSGIINGNFKGTSTITYSLGFGCTSTQTITVHPLPPSIAGAARVCVNNSITMSNTVSGGTWACTPGMATAGITTGIVKGLMSGTASITYTLTTGCITTRIVDIDSLPPAILGTIDICESDATTLSNTATGGTWSAAPGVVIVSSTSGRVSGITAGITNITYTNRKGCAALATFTVNALPTAIIGAAAVCEGLTTSLTDYSPGGVWSSGNTTVASIDSFISDISGLSSGTTTVTYALPTGCITTMLFTVNAVAPITGPSVVCTGVTISLNNAIGGGTWGSSSTTTATAGITNGLVTGVTAGNAIISYESPTGCISISDIKVNNWLPTGTITGVSSLCRGYLITLFDTAKSGVWSSTAPDVYVDATLGTVRGVAAGTATVTYGVTNSCGTAITTHTLTVIPVPTGRVISGPDSLCVGAAITLTGSITGGLWSSLNTDISVGSTTGIVTGITGGSSTVTYVYVNICGLAVEYHGVQVSPLPATGTTSGATNVCTGAVTLLSNPVPGGTWMATNGNAAVVAGMVTGITAGSDTIVYTTTTVCGSASTSATVAVNPLPYAGVMSGPASVCAGITTTVSSSVAGGSWSSSGPVVVSTAGAVTGISAGSAMITYEVSNICGTGKGIIPFTVNAQPDAGAITGADNLCVSQVTVFTNTVTGGVWSTLNSTIDTISSGGIITGISAGTDTAMYTATNVCGTAITRHGFVVNPLPDAGTITGGNEVCTGSSILLTNNTAGGTWSSNSTAVSVDNGSVTALSAGIAIIDYTVTNICGTVVTTKAVDLVALPEVAAITGAASVCEGATISLSDAVNGGIWSSNSEVASIANATLTGIRSGIDTVTYRIANSCGTATASKAIVINPLPATGTITGPDSACAGDTIVLGSNTTGGVWSNTNTEVTKLLQPAAIACIAKGADTISYTVTNTCGMAVATLPIKVRSADECYPDTTHHIFDCTDNSELMIYPNPNPGIFTINVISDIQEEIQVAAFNMPGQKILQLTTMTNHRTEINMHQPKGMYILSVSGAHGHCSKKITVNQ